MKNKTTSSLIIILKTQDVIIQYSPHVNIMLIRWMRKPGDVSFKEAYRTALQFVEERCRVTLFCTDLTSCGPLDREQEGWLYWEYYPIVYRAIQGNIFAAVVFSEEHFKAIISNYQVPTVLPQQDFIHFNYFTCQEEAFHWLEQIKRGQDQVLFPALS